MEHQLLLEHITSFADAIFAFSITFMAISIDIPNLAQNLTQTQVIDKLLQSIPEFEIYMISFFVIGVYWIAYHQIFNQIVNSDTTVTWLTRIEIHTISLGAIVPTVIYFLSILVSFSDLQAAYYFWILIIPAKIILRK